MAPSLLVSLSISQGIINFDLKGAKQTQRETPYGINKEINRKGARRPRGIFY